MRIIIDTREQRPWGFDCETRRATLATGDYSIDGLAHLVAVERKSLTDLVGCIGNGRDRFKAELQRLRAYRFRAIIIESTLADIEGGASPPWPPNGNGRRVQPSHVLGSLAHWQATYEIPIWLAGEPEAAARLCKRLMCGYVAVLERVTAAVVAAKE